jgi:hypothetical protein
MTLRACQTLACHSSCIERIAVNIESGRPEPHQLIGSSHRIAPQILMPRDPSDVVWCKPVPAVRTGDRRKKRPTPDKGSFSRMSRCMS